ncbi:hypothetical protein E2C01_083718 [Portunus trituberculatus]|uniref:Secreted protein n=1 Tax=Portunus trituberculatus TaxID=210409 RepID=A0A5B7J5L5_PORTR|nr:hypothetical protein [Portunus trituberculatus]
MSGGAGRPPPLVAPALCMAELGALCAATPSISTKDMIIRGTTRITRETNHCQTRPWHSDVDSFIAQTPALNRPSSHKETHSCGKTLRLTHISATLVSP